MKVKFHYNGTALFWNKASRVVTNEANQVVARDCYNLQQARKAAANAKYL